MGTEIRKLEVERFMVAVKKAVSEQLLSKAMDVSVVAEKISSQLVIELQQYLSANKVHSKVVEHVKYPRSWWDAVKARFAPRWFCRRFPIRYAVIDKTIQHIHVCPHLPVDRTRETYWLTEAGPHLDFLRQNQERSNVPASTNPLQRKEEWRRLPMAENKNPCAV